MRRISVLALLVLCLLLSVFAQGNGKLQIHYMDVGQGDGAVLISPLGEVVLFDDGVAKQCGRTIGYLQSLGVTKIDYHVPVTTLPNTSGVRQAFLLSCRRRRRRTTAAAATQHTPSIAFNDANRASITAASSLRTT